MQFLDTKNCKYANGKLYLTIYRKPTDRQNYLHLKSAHPPSLKKIIPFSQALRISGACTETNEVTDELKETSLKRGYQEISIDYQIKRLNYQKH